MRGRQCQPNISWGLFVPCKAGNRIVRIRVATNAELLKNWKKGWVLRLARLGSLISFPRMNLGDVGWLRASCGQLFHMPSVVVKFKLGVEPDYMEKTFVPVISVTDEGCHSRKSECHPLYVFDAFELWWNRSLQRTCGDFFPAFPVSWSMKNLRPGHFTEFVKSRKEGDFLILGAFRNTPLRLDALEAKYGMQVKDTCR